MTWLLKNGGHYLSFVSVTGALDEYYPQQAKAHRFATKADAVAARRKPGRRDVDVDLVRVVDKSKMLREALEKVADFGFPGISEAGCVCCIALENIDESYGKYEDEHLPACPVGRALGNQK